MKLKPDELDRQVPQCQSRTVPEATRLRFLDFCRRKSVHGAFGGLIPGSGEQVFKQNRTSDRLDESGFVTSLGFDLGLPLVTGRSFLLLTTFGTEYVTLRMRGKSTSQSFLKNCLSKY